MVPANPADVGIGALPLVRVDIAIAVPLGLAASQTDSVDHSAAHEPMVLRGIDFTHRIGTVAQPSSLELSRDLACYGEVESGDLLLDRSHVPGQVRIVVGSTLGDVGHEGRPYFRYSRG